MSEENMLHPEVAAAHFFGQDALRELAPFGNGNINDTWKLRIEANGQIQTLLLQRLNHLVFRQPDAVMANIARVAAHLHAKGFSDNLLQPVVDAEDNSLFRDAAANYWCVFPFLEQTTSLDVVSTPAQAFEAACAFGQFLAALSDLAPATLHETIPGFHDSLSRLKAFHQAVENDAAGRFHEVSEEVDFVLKESLVFQKLADLQLPVRVVHNDAKIGNILLHERTHKAVAVIDWDTIMPGCVLSDLGDIARTMASTCSENEANTALVKFSMPIFETICKGFIPPVNQMLGDEERDHLYLAPRWIILEQAMRFLGDYLDGDVYYKTSHARHNLERACNQLALYQSALEQEDAMQAAVRAALR